MSNFSAPDVDRVVLAALPKLSRSLRLGAFEEDAPDMGDISIGSAADILSEEASALGAAARQGVIDPYQFMRSRSAFAAINRKLNEAQERTPQVAALLKPMVRVINASSSIMNSAAQAAIQMRLASHYKALKRPNNQTEVFIKGLADLDETGEFTVKAPVSGRPFRFMSMKAEVATVGSDTVTPSRDVLGCSFSSFDILGSQRVKTDNVTLSSGSKEQAGWDLTDFSRKNADRDPEQMINPWGIGPSGWFESDFYFTFKVRNNSGRTVNAKITFYWQASPCDDESNGRGIYRGEHVVPVESNRSAKLFRNVLSYTPHPLAVSGYQDINLVDE